MYRVALCKYLGCRCDALLSYLFSIAQEDGFQRPDQCLAEVKANFMGTEYQVRPFFFFSVCGFFDAAYLVSYVATRGSRSKLST